MLYFVICVLGSIALVLCTILLLIQALANLMRGTLHFEAGDEVDVGYYSLRGFGMDSIYGFFCLSVREVKYYSKS